MLTDQYAPALERMQQLYSTGSQAICCIQIRSIAEMNGRYPQRPLNSWQFPQDNIACLEDRANQLWQYWQDRRSLGDDAIPCLSPYYGIAEHSAFLGGSVSFATDTSYHHPLLNQIADWPDLVLNQQNQWVQMFREAYSYCLERWSDRFFIKYRGAYGPMDLANMVRGNDLFLDFFDEPDQVHNLMNFCVKAIRFYLDLQSEYVPHYRDGIINGFDIWMPDGGIGHLSEDASCLCSLDQYDQFGASYLQALIEPCQTALLHLHSLGRKNVAGFARLAKIGLIQLSSDPGQPSSFDVLRENLDALRNKIVIVETGYDELVKNADLLRGLKCLLFYQAQTTAEAQEAVAFVRNGLTA
jgi:hypothetical protein